MEYFYVEIAESFRQKLAISGRELSRIRVVEPDQVRNIALCYIILSKDHSVNVSSAFMSQRGFFSFVWLLGYDLSKN